MSEPDVFDRLMEQIQVRVRELPEGSYTTKLLRAGRLKIGAKILEEVLEATVASGEEGEAGRRHLVSEASDVLYHLWVLLGSCGVGVDDLRRELARREGVSGIEEKNRRGEGRAE
jgi:phosphoribosyl-ATP pyrophosphohydrolase